MALPCGGCGASWHPLIEIWLEFRSNIGGDRERGGSLPYPAFNSSNVLPPYVGSWPEAPAGFSPYPGTIQEVVTALGITPERREILSGFLHLRTELRKLGFTIEAQWIDGSFCENIEVSEGRPPGDIDVLSILRHPADPATLHSLLMANRDVFVASQSKAAFRCDHYTMQAEKLTIRQLCYWNSLFSHRRNGLWKGYIELSDEGQANDDALIAALVP